MRVLLWQLIVPITIILFVSFSKWWLVLPVDAPDTMMKGFPLPYEAEAWHTSLAKQFFMMEFTLDVLFYFAAIALIVYAVHKLTQLRTVHWVVWVPLQLAAMVCSLTLTIQFSMPNSLYYIKKDFGYEVVSSGWYLTWKGIERPDVQVMPEYDPENSL